MTNALRAPPLNLLLGAGPPLPSRRVKVNEVFSKERLNAGRLGLLPQGASLSAVETQQVASALGYIYRGCVQFSADEASFAAALASTTEASEACGAALLGGWVQSKDAGVAAAAHALKLGELVGMEWQLGMALSSSSCSSLMAPYVRLTFQVLIDNSLV